MAFAQPAPLPFDDCFSGNASQKLNVSTVYAQVLHGNSVNAYLNITVLGQSATGILGYSNESSSVSTLFTLTSMLTLSAWENSSYFCNSLRPPSPLPTLNPTDEEPNPTYCPIPAGPFAFSQSVPWGTGRALTTLDTRLRAVDPWGTELLCIDITTTPLGPGPLHSPYGDARYIFWGTVGLAVAYWVVVGLARIVSAWSRGVSRPGAGLWSRVESAGFILASAISGERLATSPALMRFCTPSMRDIIFHTQLCAALIMVAVQWPTFIYPILAQTAWSTLSYNISLTNAAALHHWNPLAAPLYNPPADFADQLNDPSSPIYIQPTLSNSLFLLPNNTPSGMASFAYTIGLRPQDLFSVCISLFLAIIAGAILLSTVAWFIEYLAALLIDAVSSGTSQTSKIQGTRSPIFGTAPNKDITDTSIGAQNAEESRSLSGQTMFRASSRLAFSRKHWWKLRPEISSFHGSVLHGNLVRILVLFHFPVTVFSCYQMTLPHASIAPAVFAFIVFSLLFPVLLVLRVTTTSTNKLYDETRTLLCLGPLYNHYRHGSQLFASLLFASNLAFGITIGFGQNSGTTQAIVILVIEVVSALLTSVWLPWGHGAGMGLISFLFCVARIVVAVLLVILTPTISIGDGAEGWVAYGILAILALVYLAFLIVLFVKLVEAIVRIVGRIGFDHSTRVADTGLLGACLALGCCGTRPRQHRRRYRAREVPASEVSSYAPPAALAGFHKTSTYSGPPPSVLRPEHALRPYKEESDDENGFIMGAWQPFPRPGYQSVDVAEGASNASRSGFSRIGGGRAHYESPYAIAAAESVQTFPSIGQGSLMPPVFGAEGDSPSLLVSHSGAELPPGAMQPAVHIRTKSQTAIIEDLPILTGHSGGATAAMALPPGRVSEGDRPRVYKEKEQSGDETVAPKKKYWFNLRRHRPHSEGGTPARRDEEAVEEIQPQPGRSFVVIRDRRPSASPHSSSAPATSTSTQPMPSTWTGDPSSPTRERPRSFLVVRGNVSGDARGMNATQ